MDDTSELRYNIGLFDPNGKALESNKNEKNLLKLMDYLQLVIQTSTKALCYKEDLMENYSPINTVRVGNCDALSLWFIYLCKSCESIEDIRQIIEEYVNDMNDKDKNREIKTDKINKNITDMSKRTYKK